MGTDTDYRVYYSIVLQGIITYISLHFRANRHANASAKSVSTLLAAIWVTISQLFLARLVA